MIELTYVQLVGVIVAAAITGILLAGIVDVLCDADKKKKAAAIMAHNEKQRQQRLKKQQAEEILETVRSVQAAVEKLTADPCQEPATRKLAPNKKK